MMILGRTMKINKGWKELVVVTGVVVFGLLLRYHGLSRVPLPGESMDEYSNSWVGLSLIRLGVPVGRSGLLGYGGNDYRYVNVDGVFATTAGGSPLELNKPWFDHPPGLGLITGGYAYLRGARVFEDTTARLIRTPMLGFSMVVMLGVYILTKLIAGKETAGLALLLMATSPLTVVTSRMVQAENALIGLWLWSLIFLKLYKDRASTGWLLMGAVTAGLAICFKVTGIAVVLSGLVILIASNKNERERIGDTVVFGLIGLAFLSLFAVYGWIYDSDLFWKIWQSNSNRPYDIGFGAMFNLLTSTKVTVSKYLTDGWPLIGWIGVMWGLQKKWGEREKYLLVPLGVYLALFLWMGSSAYGWYRIPLLPFLYIWAAILINKGIARVGASMWLLLIPIGINLGQIGRVFDLNWLTKYWRVILPGLIIAGIIESLWRKRINKRVRSTIVVVTILVALLSNAWVSWMISSQEVWLKIF